MYLILYFNLTHLHSSVVPRLIMVEKYLNSIDKDKGKHDQVYLSHFYCNFGDNTLLVDRNSLTPGLIFLTIYRIY